MDYEQVKNAFIKADDLAQQGDEQAKEDAAYFANILKNKPKEKEEPFGLKKAGKSFLGGIAAMGDFVGNVVGDIPAGLYGLGKGIKEGISSGSLDTFFAEGSKGVEEAREAIGRNVFGKLTGTEGTPGYASAEQALGIPGELGVKAVRGVQALSKIPTQGIEGAAAYLEEPWRSPVEATIADVTGPLLGYGPGLKGTGKVISKGTEMTLPSRFEKPAPLPGYDPNVSPFPEKPVTPSRLVDPEVVRREGMDVVEEGAVNPYAQSGDLFPGEDLARYQAEADAQARGYFDTRQGQRNQPVSPLEYELSLEETPTRGELREAERDAIYKDREDFPTVDIELLPERVAKDSTIKGTITRWNNLQGKLRGLYKQASDLGVEGVRITGNQFRPNELNLSPKAKQQINALIPEIKKIEAQLNNLSLQIQKRMTNKHNIDVEGLPLFKGVVGKEKGKYANEPVDLTPPQPSGVPLNIEKTVAPNMQRSSSANITGAEMVQKTERPPLGGTGTRGFRQGGAIDPVVFKEALQKLGKFFTPEVLKKVSEKPDYKSRSRLVLMPIDAFLKFAMPFPGKTPDSFKYQGVSSYLGEGNKLDRPLDLWIDTKSEGRDFISGHEGRHRATYLKEQGIEYVPVQLNSGNIRWSEQNKPTNQFDYRQDYPDYLRNELGDSTTTFPVPREEAELPNAGVYSPTYTTKWKDSLGKGPGGKQSGGVDFGITDAIGGLLNKARKAPAPKQEAPKTKTPASRYTLEDTRDLDTFWKEESPNTSSWKDIPDNMISNFYRNITQGRFVANMSKRLNPVISFVTNKTVAIDRASTVSKENALWGNKFVSNMRGWGKRVKSEDGAMTYWEKGSEADRGKLLDVLLKFDGNEMLLQQGLKRPTTDMLAAEGLSKDQIKAAEALYNNIDKIFTRINELRAKQGMEPVNQIPGYIPHMWFGDYRVILKDKTNGETLGVFGVNNKYQRDALVKEMQRLYPDQNKYQVGAFDVRKGKYNMDDISAFQYAFSVLQKNSKEYQYLKEAYKDILAHRGFNKRSLQRKGVKGFAGSKGGAEGVADFAKGIEAYINQGYNFIANQEKRMLLSDIEAKMQENPNVNLAKTQEYLNDYVKNSTGAIKNQLEFIDNYIFEPAGELTRFGPEAVKNGIKNMSSLSSAFFLTSSKFLMVNALQPLYNVGKLRNIALDFETGKSLTRVFGQAYLETFLGQASKLTKEGLTFAKQNGFIDAKTLDLVDSKLTKTSLANQSIFKVAKHTLGWWEQEAVRTPTFVMYDLMLRDTIKDNKERWQTAGALTDQYMVDYGKTESPAFYSQMGTVGEAIRPLKQYGHAYAGQLGELIQLAKEDKQYTPLAGFLGVQVTLGGLKGMIGIGVANSLINYINESFGTTMQTPEEWLLTSGLSSSMVYGPVSTITGLDISGSVSAPGVEDIFTAPGLEAPAKAAGKMASLVGKAARGTVTEMDEMGALLSTIPNPHAKAMIEQIYTEPGMPTPDPSRRGLPAVTEPRSKGEQIARALTGAELTREQQEKAVVRSMRREEMRKSSVKKEIMNKFIDTIYQGEEINQDLLQKYAEMGGDPRNIKQELVSWIKDSIMGQLQAEIMKGSPLAQAQKMEKLQEFSAILENAELDDLISVYKEGM